MGSHSGVAVEDLRRLTERLPDNVRDRTKQVAEKAGEVWDKVPGNNALERALATAIKGGFDMALDITESTINERKVVERVTKGLAIEATSYDDLRGLDLATLDERAPKNAKSERRWLRVMARLPGSWLVARPLPVSPPVGWGRFPPLGSLRWPSSPTPPPCRLAPSRVPPTWALTMATTRHDPLSER